MFAPENQDNGCFDVILLKQIAFMESGVPSRLGKLQPG